MSETLRDLRTEGRITDGEHEERMRAARARAEWELGYAGWADTIIAAYMNPDDDRRRLRVDWG